MFSDPRQVLGKYQLIAEIARGGMGVVYLAMAQGPGGFSKLVVVKELNPELVDDPAFRTMFLDEAKLAARLNHPNIVQTNEVGNDGDMYFMVMDYLDGRGLDRIRRRTRTAGFGLSLSMQLRIIIDILAGLDYAHNLTDFDGTALNIVHRDVSPQNVFVTFDGQIKLLDFGIAKAADTTHQTHAGVLKGKISYISPEQARGQKVDARGDVFSAGVILWEVLAGRSLRDGKNDNQMLRALTAADLPRASSVKPWVPPELDEICARAMAWNRDDRYRSAAAFRTDLEQYLTTTGTNVSAREVGVCVSEMFQQDRARTNALIEAHVARVRRGAARGALPVIDVASRSGPGGTPSTPERSLVPPDAPELEDVLTVQPSSVSSAAPSGPHLAEPRRRSRSLIVAGGAAVAVLAGIGFLALRSPAELPPAAAHLAVAPSSVAPLPSTLAPAASVAEAPAVARKANLVKVEIRVSPATAKLEIDEVEVASNPFTGSYLAESTPHHVRATAPGYVTKSVTIGFDANVRLDLSLEHLPAPAVISSRPMARSIPAGRSSPPPHLAEAPSVVVAPPASVPAPPAPASAPPKPAGTAPEAGPAGGSKPHRAIDPNNPYEKE